MSSSPVAPISVAPISAAAAALRVEIIGAAEAELLAVVGASPDIAPQSSVASKPQAPTPATAAQPVDAARAVAAGQQASLAPLFADLAETLGIPGLPSAVKTAVAQVLALQLPTEGPIAPQQVRQAVIQSGLFLEADLASAPPGSPPPLDLKAALLTLQQALPSAPPPTPAAPPGAEGAPPPRAPATAPNAPATTASPQGSSSAAPAPAASPPIAVQTPQVQPSPQTLAPVAAQAAPGPAFIEPAQPIATPNPSAPAVAPAGAVAGQVPSPPEPVAGSPVPQGVAQPPAEPTAPGVAQPQALPEALLAAILPDGPETRDPKAALLYLQQAPAPSAPGEAAPATQRAPPPARDAALAPQAPAPATLPKTGDLSAVLQHLRPEVEQALARLTLHQLSSLPDGASSAWMFELPVATPKGTAIAQFEVEQDGAGSGGAEGAAPWRARFSIDLEPLGPVHVHLAMAGDKVQVSVWAERPASFERLRDEGAQLAEALPAEVVFRPGSPGGAAPASGHFLDQTS